MAVTQNKRYVSFKETTLYGIANGGQVIGYNMVRNQLTFFLVTVFGVPAQAVATMILAIGLWDAFNDPLMGSIVDRTRTRFGKLRPYLLFVPIPLGIATVVFFGGAKFLEGVDNVNVKIRLYVYYIFYMGISLYHRRYSVLGAFSRNLSESCRQVEGYHLRTLYFKHSRRFAGNCCARLH